MLQTIISALIKFVEGQRRIRQRFRKFPSPDLGAREGTHAQMEFIINGGGVILARIGRATQKERERERERERDGDRILSQTATTTTRLKRAIVERPRSKTRHQLMVHQVGGATPLHHTPQQRPSKESKAVVT